MPFPGHLAFDSSSSFASSASSMNPDAAVSEIHYFYYKDTK